MDESTTRRGTNPAETKNKYYFLKKPSEKGTISVHSHFVDKEETGMGILNNLPKFSQLVSGRFSKLEET